MECKPGKKLRNFSKKYKFYFNTNDSVSNFLIDLKEEKQLQTQLESDQNSGNNTIEPVNPESTENDQKQDELPDLNSFEQSDMR